MPPDHDPPSEARVRSMFDEIVPRYDVVNGGLSLGLDRRWRSSTVRAARVRPEDRVLDVGTGTGRLIGSAPGGVRWVGIDVSYGMLERARRRVRRGNLVQGSVFRMPFKGASFDRAVSAFVLRNLADLETAFAELARVVHPRGTIALLDITSPPNPVLRAAFLGYFHAAAPLLGRIVGRADAYRYLVRSVATLPPAEEVCRILGEAGFEQCRARSLMGGVVTLWTASRP
jgi:demethylmenaquinone methyltransferase/2-methoxy-6-polyprenyl-1,4-benzoquinol methylase